MRGVMSLFVVAVMALGLSVMPGTSSLLTPEPARASGMVVGDVDCDGSVTAADAAAVLRGVAAIDDGCDPGLADVNCSAEPDLGDVLLLRRFVSGLQVSGPAGCPAIGTAYQPSGPASSERIDEALQAGEITKGQAALFRLYADLDPARLPLPFRGPVDEQAHIESAMFQELGASWNSLSQSEQQALRPYLLSPSEPGSWVEEGDIGALAAVQWETVSNDRIKVWWQTRRPEDAAKAAAILDELDSYIWPELVNYMGAAHAPFSDSGYQGSGGDGRYDVYLVHNAPSEPGKEPVLGWVSPMLDAKGNMKCDVTPTHMIVNSRAPLSDVLFSTLAHEFMHSVQFTYDVGSCDDYRWLMESTATWVESWLYPDVNQEHGFASKYLEQLDTNPLELWRYADERQYGSYLFWYHEQWNDGRFNAVRDVWNASAEPDSLVAVNTAVGGIRDAWPESALHNWNRAPYENFTTLDQLPFAAKWNDTDVTAGNAPTSYAVPTDVGHMQQRHLNYTIDSSVKGLTFINPFSGNYDYYAKVQALVAIDGEWQPQALDWTSEDRVSFCFDRPGEKVTQLVIIITNSNYLDRTHVLDAGPGELVATPNGCNGWVGSATAEIQYFDTTFHITVDNLRFAPDEENPGNDRYDFYELVEAGTATWTVSGSWFETCTPSGTMTLKPPKTDPTAIGGYFHVDKLNNTYDVHISGNTYEDTLIITCPNSDPWARSWPVSSVLADGATFRPIPEDGVISEEYSESSYSGSGTWQWNFTRVD